MGKATIFTMLLVSLVIGPLRADSPDPAPAPQRLKPGSPWLAAAEVIAINLGVWGFTHYTSGPDYTYISWETMRENFRDGWEFDRSRYFVNFYHHPYHGYLYFNVGRANGFGFWGSALTALGGSLMWELVMESNRPSINDLVTTTAGGCVYGEIGYRLSSLVRTRRGRGLGRVWREAVGAILDPVGGINRLLNHRGRGGQRPSAGGEEKAGLSGEVVLSGPVIGRSAELSGSRAVPTVGFALEYGDPAGRRWSGRPFDMFSVRGLLRLGPDRPHLSLFVNGALFGRRIAASGKGSHFAGLYQHYEYYGIDTLRVCGTSFSAGWTSRFDLPPRLRLAASVRLGVLGLGGSDDFYADSGERRSYNFGTGWTAAAELGVVFKEYECVSASWRHYGLRDLAVAGGRGGHEYWDILQARVRVPVRGGLGIGLAAEHCRRGFDFIGHEPGSRRLFEVRAFAALQF